MLRVSPRIVGLGRVALGTVLVEAVRACAKEIAGKADVGGGTEAVAMVGAAVGGTSSACQSNMAAEVVISGEIQKEWRRWSRLRNPSGAKIANRYKSKY